MLLKKYLQVKFLFLCAVGFIFSTDKSTFFDGGASISSLNSEVSQILEQPTSGLGYVLTTEQKENDISAVNVPNWAKNLISDVASVKKNQDRILSLLELSPPSRRLSLQGKRRNSSVSTTGGIISFSKLPQIDTTGKRFSCSGALFEESIGFSASDNLTEGEKEAEHIAAINRKNQDRANHKKDLIGMRLLAKNSFREEHPDTAWEYDDLDLESDIENNFNRRLDARSKTGKFAEQLRAFVSVSALEQSTEDSMSNSSDLKKDVTAASEAPKTSNFSPVCSIISPLPKRRGADGSLPSTCSAYFSLEEDQQAHPTSTSRKGRAASYTPATEPLIASAAMQKRTKQSQGAQRPLDKFSSTPKWLKTVVFSDTTPTVMQDDNRSFFSDISPNSTSLRDGIDSLPTIKQ